MDNAAFHKSVETKEIIEGAGRQLLFLPPYSPDLNPIEKCWENLKAIIKKIIGSFKTLAEAVDFAFFFWAPALCWWERTIVESIIAYSLSASSDNNLKTCSQTPVLHQRVCLV